MPVHECRIAETSTWIDFDNAKFVPCWLNFRVFLFFQLKMQEVLPQPVEAAEAYMDSHVQEAAQEGHCPRSRQEKTTCQKEAFSRCDPGSHLETKDSEARGQ
ncbi:hypothetical protein MLD38_012298 [Melastoma candidum]|uniref:Uncharacterized protein n=1 Tax=Melastoma candidum TaxID=119954 RepID=A0ACB9REB0_9MYRT|nr:hypothetical protein MLD38_012298 [Melastoma candidum]